MTAIVYAIDPRYCKSSAANDSGISGLYIQVCGIAQALDGRLARELST